MESSSDNTASEQTGRWQGERDGYTAKVCTDHKQVIEFFGHGWLAKDLYDEAGIDSAERVF